MNSPLIRKKIKGLWRSCSIIGIPMNTMKIHALWWCRNINHNSIINMYTAMLYCIHRVSNAIQVALNLFLYIHNLYSEFTDVEQVKKNATTILKLLGHLVVQWSRNQGFLNRQTIGNTFANSPTPLYLKMFRGIRPQKSMGGSRGSTSFAPPLNMPVDDV